MRRHARVSPFESAGCVDISADVDFEGVAEGALSGSEGVDVHGPVEQAGWLGAMGGRERMDVLRARGEEERDVRDRVEEGWRRLVDRGPGGMGKVYKVMGVVARGAGGRGEGRRPVGFGGDVEA